VIPALCHYKVMLLHRMDMNTAYRFFSHGMQRFIYPAITHFPIIYYVNTYLYGVFRFNIC